MGAKPRFPIVEPDDDTLHPALVLGLCFALSACAVVEPAPAGLQQAIRPDDLDPSELVFHFEAEDVIETHDGAQVRVHFTRQGDNAVRGDDGNDNGVPDDVEEAALRYDAVLTRYETLGFLAPVSDEATTTGNGGDGKLDVYLLDFGQRSDGSFVREQCDATFRSVCAGYVVQENDFAGYPYESFAEGTRVLATHELFHAIQAAYDADQGANFAEGTAVWASEELDPELPDFEAQIGGFLAATELSLDQDPAGIADGRSYGMGLVFKYFAERFGSEIVRAVLEGCRDSEAENPRWIDVLTQELAVRGTSFADAYLELAHWTLRSGLGGEQTWKEAMAYPRVERVDARVPFVDESVRMFRASLRVFTFPPEGELHAQLVDVGTDPAPLALWIVARTGNLLTFHEVTGTDEAVLASDGADEMMVAVVNPLATGSSIVTKLCAGSAEDVAACRGDLSDAGAATPAGNAGGCAIGETSPFQVMWLPIMLALLARRRHSR